MQISLKKSIGVRLAIMVGLTAVLLYPTAKITELINEREARKNEAVAEIVSKWGPRQKVSGPIITVPFCVYSRDAKGVVVSEIKQQMSILPEKLTISGTITPEIRYREIYEAVVYRSSLKINGTVPNPDLRSLNIEEARFDWKNASLTFGITNLKGINEQIKIVFDGKSCQAVAGSKTDHIATGVSVSMPIDSGKKSWSFQADIQIIGSEELSFNPMAKEANIEISSSWKNPSFSGEVLPSERVVNHEGFRAQWRLLNLHNRCPQAWAYEMPSMPEAVIGVGLLLPVDGYQTTMRTSKYALLFIVLTFLSFFLMEVVGKKAIHPMQYLLIGAAQTVFYVLLLSISEHIAFSWAYLMGDLQPSFL